MGGFARIKQDFMDAVLHDGVPEKVSGSVQLIPKVPYGTLWRVDSGEDIYTVPASQINCDIVNGKLFRSGKPYVDIFAEDLGTIWSVIYTNVIVDGRPRHIHTMDFMVTPGEYTDLNRLGEVGTESLQITLGIDMEARDQFRAALTAWGLDYATITEVPFEIELVGTGSARDLFRGCAALTTAPAMNTSGVTNMRSMFNACNALTTVPEMDTSQVTNMAWMFTHCYALTTVPVMDTSQVTAMNNMFDYCTALTSVPEMDTSQVTNINQMFYGCSLLTTVPDMNTSQVTTMRSMFYNCSALTDGNVRLIGRHPDVDTTGMIEGSSLTREPFYLPDGTPDDGPTIEVVQITLGESGEAQGQFRAALTARGMDHTTVTEIPFDIELVGTGSVQYMFDGCTALTSVPEMDTSQVTDMNYMFLGCSSLTYVPDMDTSRVMGTISMFDGCAALTDGNVRLIGRHPNVDITYMIIHSGLTREPFYLPDGTPDDGPATEVVQITLGTGMQARDEFRAALTARGLDYATITEIPFDIELVGTGEAIHLFRGCVALTTIPPLNTINVTNMNGMFQECGSLVTVPPLDTSNVVRAPSMFAYCRSMTNVPDMQASKIIDASNMFTGCVALTDGNVRLIGRNPTVKTASMISSSGLTREPWYTAGGTPIGPRKVTIEKDPSFAGFNQPATGDVSLIGGWIGSSGEVGASFVAPVTCNLDLRNANNFSTIRAGVTIPTGQGVYPTYSPGTPYVFTEVL